MADYGSNWRPADADYYDLTPEELEAERIYCKELQRRMLEAELDPHNFFRLNKGGRFHPLLRGI